MKQLFIIKVGGNIIDDEARLKNFLDEFSSINEHKILVHGGGKLATRLAQQLGIEQQMVDGRRITDVETLKIVTMVYAGFVNKNIVAMLQARGSDAIGICGADGNAITAHKRFKGTIDYGFAGDIDTVNAQFFTNLIESNKDIVVAPITHDKKSQLLNTNADTIAQEIAAAMSSLYNVTLMYGFEKAGVLRDANDDQTVIKNIDKSTFKQLKEANVIFEGMIPKLENALAAIDRGVRKVVIGRAEQLTQLTTGEAGTTIS